MMGRLRKPVALTVEIEDTGMKADLLKPARRMMAHTFGSLPLH